MAEAKEKDNAKYFRSSIAGLKLVVGPPLEGEVSQETVAFDQYQEKWQGDTIKVGYLKTDDARAIQMADADINVTEITKDEYEQFTNPDVNPKVKKLV